MGRNLLTRPCRYIIWGTAADLRVISILLKTFTVTLFQRFNDACKMLERTQHKYTTDPLTFFLRLKASVNSVSCLLLGTVHTHYLGYNHLPFLFASPSGNTLVHLSIKAATNALHMRAKKRRILEIPSSILLFTHLIGRQISLLTWVIWCEETEDGYSVFRLV